MRNFLQILAVVSLVLAGVSPACKFISGETQLIEICGAFGLKTVEVPAEQDSDHKKSEGCAFCFAAAHYAGLKAGSVAVAPIQIKTESVLTERDSLFSFFSSSSQPRGPPSFLA